MTSMTVLVPARISAPRSAHGLAALFLRLLAWQRRSATLSAERQAIADRIREAAAVRDYALRFASEDPRFAADLLAAADRHEREV